MKNSSFCQIYQDYCNFQFLLYAKLICHEKTLNKFSIHSNSLAKQTFSHHLVTYLLVRLTSQYQACRNLHAGKPLSIKSFQRVELARFSNAYQQLFYLKSISNFCLMLTSGIVIVTTRLCRPVVKHAKEKPNEIVSITNISNICNRNSYTNCG